MAPLAWESRGESPGKRAARAHTSAARLWKNLLRGAYPELVAEPDRDISLWHSSYIQTYLERDVRSLRQVGDLTAFQGFIRALAARAGQLLNLTDVARDLGIAVNTAKAWLSVLEATFQVIVLRPYHANVGKRLVKTPKIYFTDTGMLCYLAGLRGPEHAAAGPLGGAIFETAVLVEIVKVFVNRGETPQVYFWRTSAGVAVDFVVEADGKLIPIEVKLSSSPRPRWPTLSELSGKIWRKRLAPVTSCIQEASGCHLRRMLWHCPSMRFDPAFQLPGGWLSLSSASSTHNCSRYVPLRCSRMLAS